MPNQTPTVAVIGGGIAGLAAAQRLNVLRPDWPVTIFESRDRLGGVIYTERDQGYLIEHAADNFLRGPTAPWAESLAEEIGFAEQLIPTEATNRGAHVLWRGRLHPVPAGFQLMAPSRLWPIMTSSLLSPLGKFRLACEPFIRRRVDAAERAADESLTEFATRRLGREGFERLVQPLVSGIYTADPDQLSVAAALPQMVQMEREHGSLYRAMQQRRRAAVDNPGERGARYGLFVAPRGGMSDFVAAVHQSLTATTTRLGTQIDRLQIAPGKDWQLGVNGQMIPFDGLIVATSTAHAGTLLAEAEPRLASELREIPAASSSVVCLGLEKSQVRRTLDAFGCVIPSAERRRILAISYTSLKFPDRAPPGHVMLRVFVGGALHGELADLPDDELTALAVDEVNSILGVSGAPQWVKIVRWPNAMPQYHRGHLDRVARIEQFAVQNGRLQLAGNGYRGVGIPQCVLSGRTAAERLVSQLSAEVSRQ